MSAEREKAFVISKLEESDGRFRVKAALIANKDACAPILTFLLTHYKFFRQPSI
jgi:hypothetical protein